MTLIAGAFAISPSQRPLDAGACAALRELLSRHPGEQVLEHRDHRACLLKVDIGAFAAPAFDVRPDGSAAMLSGDPLLARIPRPRNRTSDLAVLRDGWARGQWDIANRATGIFSAVYYDRDLATLHLIADPLGMRPIYYALVNDTLFFASTLRVLAGLPGLTKSMDVRAVTEIAALGYPLGTRTPFAEIQLLGPAEVVHVSPQGLSRQRYRSWDDAAISTAPVEQLLEETYAAFSDACARRLGPDRTVAANLTGGMDSRSVVAELWRRGLTIHTLNGSASGEQDQVFAAEFAQHAGTLHQEIPGAARESHFLTKLGDAWRRSPARQALPPEHPDIMWAGSGGSLVFGHIYQTAEVANHLRAGRVREAIHCYQQAHGIAVPRKILRRGVRPRLAAAVETGIAEELRQFNCADPARAFYLFLLFNDQRRHWGEVFEDIDRSRLEFHTPFYDADFVATVMRCPLDLCLGHDFYTRWLACLPAIYMSVPWQTYPGHALCPLPVRQGLQYQWDPAYVRQRGALRETDLREVSELLRDAEEFPAPLLSRSAIRMASWVSWSGLRDYGYLIRSARIYQSYWKACAGAYVLP